MLSVFSPIAELSAEEVRRVTEVTYLGYVHGTLSALRRMRPRDRGVIVQVGSALAYRAIPLQAAYAPPSTRSRASPRRSAANSCTTKVTSKS
jgi:NAD(P)-dependent dehydrogenase (short-subunit alcohol dehydrogenase family)